MSPPPPLIGEPPSQSALPDSHRVPDRSGRLPYKHGVLFVHGVGGPPKSDTLLGFGEPLFDWLVRWYDAANPREPSVRPRVTRSHLGFASVDIGDSDDRVWATVELPKDGGAEQWLWTEAWWGTSTRRPDFADIFSASLRHYLKAAGRLIEIMSYRVQQVSTNLLDRLDRSTRRPRLDWWWLLWYPIVGLLLYLILIPRLLYVRMHQAYRALEHGHEQVDAAVTQLRATFRQLMRRSWSVQLVSAPLFLFLVAVFLGFIATRVVLWLLQAVIGIARFSAAVFQKGNDLLDGFERHVGQRPSDSIDPPIGALVIDTLYSIGVLLIYVIGAALGYVILTPLMVLSRLPIPAVQDFILLTLIRPFLVINAGEFRSYLVDDLQATNMHRRVAEGITWLAKSCQDIIVICHSQGCVLTFGLLSTPHPELPASAIEKVTKLITVAPGLNKAWDATPALARLQGALPAHIHWLDMWSSFDVIPVGWLRPPRHPSGSNLRAVTHAPETCPEPQYARIYAPGPAVVARQHLYPRCDPNPYSEETSAPAHRYWPISEQVTNEMDLLTDHGTYWGNDEQVLGRMAAEIDAPFYRTSWFWHGAAKVAPEQVPLDPQKNNLMAKEDRALKYPPRRTKAICGRGDRVGLLSLGRATAVAVLLVLVARLWAQIWHMAGDVSGVLCAVVVEPGGTGQPCQLDRLPPEAVTARMLADALRWIHDHNFWPLTLLNGALSLPFGVLGLAFGGLVGWALFSIFRWFWSAWDDGERRRSMWEIVRDEDAPLISKLMRADED